MFVFEIGFHCVALVGLELVYKYLCSSVSTVPTLRTCVTMLNLRIFPPFLFSFCLRQGRASLSNSLGSQGIWFVDQASTQPWIHRAPPVSCHLSAGIKSTHHHTWLEGLIFFFFLFKTGFLCRYGCPVTHSQVHPSPPNLWPPVKKEKKQQQKTKTSPICVALILTGAWSNFNGQPLKKTESFPTPTPARTTQDPSYSL